MSALEPLQCLVLDGRGGARHVKPADLARRAPGEVAWLHLDYKDPRAIAWLREESGVDEVFVEALSAPDPRPRSLVLGDALLVVLRGANPSAGADADDLVALRLWIEGDRVLSFRHRRLGAVQEVVDQLAAGNGPTSAGELLQEVVDRMLVRIVDVVSEIEEAADELEERVLDAGERQLRMRLSALRRTSIALRRHIAPQRDTIGRLHAERVTWLDDASRSRLRESADRITRSIEDLDAARDRAAVTYEELGSRIAEEMNATMYRLTVVAAIFLPLGLLTGLLGINVGGIPGTDSPSAFAVVCVGLLLLGLAQWWWFKRRDLV